MPLFLPLDQFKIYLNLDLSIKCKLKSILYFLYVYLLIKGFLLFKKFLSKLMI